MAIYDRWWKTRRSADGERVRSAEYGCTNRWQVRWRDENGKQCKRNFPKKDGKDPNRHAAAFDAKIQDQLNAGTYIDPNAGTETFRARTTKWRGGLTVDPSTLEIVDTRLKWIYSSGIADKSMAELALNPSMCQQWIKGMEDRLGAGTIRGVVRLAKSVFAAAVDDGIITRNPLLAKSVKAPPVTKKKVVPLTLDQVHGLEAALIDRYAALPVLGAGSGLRQGELFGIAAEDIDWLGRIIHVRRQVRLVKGALYFSPPKGGKTRTVPLGEAVALRLSAHIAQHPPTTVTLPWLERGKPNTKPVTAELLFTSPRGAIRRVRFNRRWREARVEAGLPDTPEYGTHVLRHTFASAMLSNLVDVRVLAEYLGHDDPGFTLRIYSHLMPDAADRARKAMDVFFASSALDVPSEGAK